MAILRDEGVVVPVAAELLSELQKSSEDDCWVEVIPKLGCPSFEGVRHPPSVNPIPGHGVQVESFGLHY